MAKLTVGDMKKALDQLPDDMEIVVDMSMTKEGSRACLGLGQRLVANIIGHGIVHKHWLPKFTPPTMTTKKVMLLFPSENERININI